MLKSTSQKVISSLDSGFSKDASLSYRGRITERQAEMLMSWSEHVLTREGWSLQPHKRAMRCIIELLQNLSKHAGFGTYECGVEPNGTLRLMSTNVVDRAQEQHIREALKQAAAPEPSELRETRLDKLVEGERTSLGGAGLGFMDLRTCSNDQMCAEFIPCGNEQSNFVLTVRIHPQS